ncbi:hypothetical protein ACIPSA_39750 [Streptomyces sp. NPDC086549]|uniref:hypothetical protein n=1 Tax=Streptomyces sp. NPDC086549 TaxID=3365752 RepID=UPI003805CEAE
MWAIRTQSAGSRAPYALNSSGSWRVSGITAIHTDATAAPVALPQSIAGVKEKPADLKITSLTADGADSTYVDAHGDKAMYVLHLRAALTAVNNLIGCETWVGSAAGGA